MRLTTQGIVLRETNYKEADKILTVLTRDLGKRTVKARGCRRKNSKLTAASQLLVYSEMTLSERGEFTTLTEADPLEQFWSVRQDLEDLALASYFAEVTEATAQEGEAAPELLSLLLNSGGGPAPPLPGGSPLRPVPGAGGGRGVHAPVPRGPGRGPVHRGVLPQAPLLLRPAGGGPPSAGPGHGGLPYDPAGAGVSDIGLLQTPA